MPRKTKNLIAFTDARIRQLTPPKDGRVEWYDDVQPGLLVRVTSTGAKTFYVLKRIRTTRQLVREKLGRFESDINVGAAREMAIDVLRVMTGGINPVQQRRATATKKVTLGQVFAEYKGGRTDRLKDRTLRDYGKMLDRYLADWLDKPAVAITRDMVERRHAKITENHGPHAANDTMRVLRAILNFVGDKYEDADGRSILRHNPVRRLTADRAWNRTARRRTVLADADFPKWWQGLQVLRKTYPDVTDLFTVCFLTGMRPGEAARLQVDKVNLDTRTLTVEDTKNRDPLVLPLPTYVHALLRRRCEAAKAAKSGFVFPGTGKTKHLVEWKKGTIELRKKTSLPEWQAYDLRRTYLTIAESLDLSPYTLKALVNHRQPRDDVTGGYINLSVERLRKPTQRIEDAMLKRAGVKPPAGVVPMRKPDRA